MRQVNLEFPASSFPQIFEFSSAENWTFIIINTKFKETIKYEGILDLEVDETPTIILKVKEFKNEVIFVKNTPF